jgi:hypothetical protein
MSPAFSPTPYVISTRRKAKRELLLLPAMNDTIGQLDQPEFCTTFQRDILPRHFWVRVLSAQPRSRSLGIAVSLSGWRVSRLGEDRHRRVNSAPSATALRKQSDVVR